MTSVVLLWTLSTWNIGHLILISIHERETAKAPLNGASSLQRGFVTGRINQKKSVGIRKVASSTPLLVSMMICCKVFSRARLDKYTKQNNNLHHKIRNERQGRQEFSTHHVLREWLGDATALCDRPFASLWLATAYVVPAGMYGCQV